MDINVAKLEKGIIGVVCLGLVSFSLYLAYTLFFGGPQPEANPTISSIDVGALGGKMQKAASVLIDPSQKLLITKADMAFASSTLYNSFVDAPIDVPMSESRGREDPFVPYVAP